MSNNITIKDANNTNVVLHTIEDATSVHFNQSIPTDTANNTATVVSGGQAVASGMGALVVAQRDGLPAGTNHLGKVSIVGSVSIQQTSGLFVQAQGIYLATPPTLVDATVSTLQTDSRGSLRVTLVSPDSNGGIGKTSSFTDANVNNQNRVVAETYPMVYNAASNTWDRITGTSVGINTVGKARYNATVPTHADATVSVLQMGARGALHTQIQGGDSNVTWAFGADNADGVAATGSGVPKIGSHTKIWNTAGSTWDRWDGKVSVGNTNNIPVSIAGVPNVNIAGAIVSNTGTAIITFSNNALYTVGFNYGWDGANWRRIDVDTNGKANVSISNTLNIGVSIAAGRVSTAGLVSVWDANTVVPDTDAKVWQGFNNSIAVATNYVFNRNSNTWDRMTGTSVGLAIVGTVSVTGPLPAGTNLIGAVSISPNGLNIPVSAASAGFPNGDALGLQTAHALRTMNANFVYNKVSDTWDRMQGTSVGIYVQGNASAGATNLGRMLPVGGTDGTNNRTLLTTTGGALVVHISNALPAAGASMLQTVGAAVTTEGYPMLGSDGTLARRLLTTTGGALVVHVSNAQPAASGISMLQTVGAAVTTEGYPMLGSDGTNARRLLTTTGGALVVHVSNSAPGGGAGGSTQLVSVGGLVSTQAVQIAGTDGTNARTFLTDTTGRLAIASIGQKVAVSVNGGQIVGQNNLDGQGTQQGMFVHNQGSVFNRNSNTWDRMTGTSVGLAVIQGGTWNVGLNAGTNLVGAVSISPNGLNIPVSVAGTITVGTHAVTQSGVWNVTALTSINSTVQVSVANANNIAVSLAPPTFNVPVSVHPVTQSGTWNVGLNAGTNLIGAVSISPNGLNIPVSIANTVNVATHAVTQSGTWNIGAITSINSIVKVSIEGTFAGGGGSTMTQTVGAAVTTQGYPMLGTDGTNARGLLTTTGGALVVHISNALPAAGASMLQTVGAAVTNQGYPMLGTDGTNARGLLTTTQGALIVHVSNTAPGGGGGGGSTQLVSIGGAVSTQAVQIAGKDSNGDARTIKTNVSGVSYISTRTFMSQYTFSRPADTTAYAAGATAAPGNAGDLIANSTTNTLVKPLKFRIAKGPGQVAYIRGARMYRTGGTLATGQHNIAGAIRLHLFNTATKVSVAGGDNAALNASPVSNWMGYIDLVAIACAPGLRTSGAVSTQVYWGSPARTGEMIVDLSAAQVSIQGLLETRIAFTPISGEIFTVQIEGFNG